MSLPGWTLPATAVLVIVGSGLFGIYSYADTNAKFPYTASSTKSASKPVIPVWTPGDEGASAEQSSNIPTPTPLPTSTRSPSSGAAETPTDPWAGEHMEAASQEPFDGELKELDEAVEGDDLLGGAFSDHASHPSDSAPSEVESPLPENTTTSFQNPVQPATDQHTGVAPQQVPTLIPPTDTETVLPPPKDATSPWGIDDGAGRGSDKMKRVLIVEDPRALGGSLAMALDREPDLEIVGRTSSAAGCRNFVAGAEGVGVSIVDPFLPDGQGTDLIKELRRSCPHTPVLVLTMSPDPRDHERAMNAGANAVLSKDAGLDEIISTVRRLSRP